MELLSSPLPAISPLRNAKFSKPSSLFPQRSRLSRQKSLQAPSAKKKGEEFSQRGLKNGGKFKENKVKIETDGPDFVFRFGDDSQNEKLELKNAQVDNLFGDDSQNEKLELKSDSQNEKLELKNAKVGNLFGDDAQNEKLELKSAQVDNLLGDDSQNEKLELKSAQVDNLFGDDSQNEKLELKSSPVDELFGDDSQNEKLELKNGQVDNLFGDGTQNEEIELKDDDEWGTEKKKSTSKVSAIADEWGEKGVSDGEQEVEAGPSKDDDEWGTEKKNSASKVSGIADEWGEKGENEPESLGGSDPPKDDDEWGRDLRNGAYVAASTPENDVEDLKQCLVDSFYGVEFGLAASSELRAEILELINQLEAANPTPAPMEATELLDGNWVLLYTAYSELLPLIAIGRAPLLKVKRISQYIDTQSSTIKNATTISSPFASISFSASASFEVQTSSRIQVSFREGSFEAPEVSQSIDLPESTEIFGQRVNLQPLQQALGPIQAAASSIAAVISGVPPLKVPIPGERSQSWLVTTFLDKDLRISRGDGGLFVLAREGSSLLNL